MQLQFSIVKTKSFISETSQNWPVNIYLLVS